MSIKPHNLSDPIHRWVTRTFNGNFVAYIIIVCAMTYLLSVFSYDLRQQGKIQQSINQQAKVAKELAAQTAREALIVAQNQNIGTHFFLQECVTNKDLLEFESESRIAAAKRDLEVEHQFRLYHETAMANIVRQRVVALLNNAARFRELEPRVCEFTAANPRTGKLTEIVPSNH